MGLDPDGLNSQDLNDMRKYKLRTTFRRSSLSHLRHQANLWGINVATMVTVTVAVAVVGGSFQTAVSPSVCGDWNIIATLYQLGVDSSLGNKDRYRYCEHRLSAFCQTFSFHPKVAAGWFAEQGRTWKMDGAEGHSLAQWCDFHLHINSSQATKGRHQISHEKLQKLI
jgi:hypothetical protein